MTINIAHIFNIKEHANFSSLITPPPQKKRLVFNKMGIMFTSLLTGVNSVLYTWYLSKKHLNQVHVLF